MPFPSPGLLPIFLPSLPDSTLSDTDSGIISRDETILPDLVRKYSGVVINQNQVVSDPGDYADGLSGTYRQDFFLPSDYRRGTESGELRYPDISGFQLLVEVQSGYAQQASFEYILQYQVFGLGWITVVAGVNIGAPTDGKTWMTVYFDNPVEIDQTKADARWRITFTGRTISGEAKNVPVEYKDGVANVYGNAIPANLTDHKPYAFELDGIPAFLIYYPEDKRVLFSYQQGIRKFWYSSPNPLALPHSIKGTLSNTNNTPIIGSSGEVSFNFRVLALSADDGMDFLGNQYRSVVSRNKPDNISTALGADRDAYWLSKPNPSKFAVENLYFDVRKPGSTTYGHVNLFKDPGFEANVISTSNVGEFFKYAGGSVDPVQLDVNFDTGRTGSGRSLHMKRNTGTNNVGVGYPITGSPIVRGITYSAGAWVKATAGVTIQQYVDYLDPGYTSQVAPGVIATGNWQYVWWTFTLPPSSTSGQLYLWMTTVDTTKEIWIDDMTVWRGTDTPYPLDATMENVVWTGAAYNSPSAELIPPTVADVSSVIDRMIIDPVTPGVFFSVYYTNEGEPGSNEDDWEAKLWTRVPQTYRMERRETHVFPEPIQTKYLKVEFSHLQAKHYAPGNFQQTIRYKKHPKWVLDYFLARLQADQGNPFLAERVAVIYDALDLAYNYYLDDLGQEPSTTIDVNNTALTQVTSFLSSRTDASDRIDPITLDKINLVLDSFRQHPALRGSVNSLLAHYARETVDYTADYSIEQPRPVSINSPDVSSLNRDRVVIEQNYPAMFFFLTCRHAYREVEARFSHDRAYFAGVRELAFLRDNYMTAFDTTTYIEPNSDTLNVERNEFVN